MESTFRFIIFALGLLCLSDRSCRVVGADSGDNVPVTYRINQKQMECIYEVFEKGDFATFSVFIVEALNSGTPKGTASFEGPIAGNDGIMDRVNELLERKGSNDNNEETNASIGRMLKKGMHNHWPIIKNSDQKLRYDKRMGLINRSLKVDWTHAGETEDALAARAEIEQEKREAYRNKGRGPPQEEDPIQAEKFKTKVMAKIEPFEETSAIKAPGWYKLCVTSDYHALVVEMDIRSGQKMGGVDRSTGHVYTHEAREMLDEEKSIDEMDKNQADANTYSSLKEEQQKEIENQVKEQDLHATKAQVKHLWSMVAEMKKKHNAHHHRIKSHNATAQRNYESMVWSSKLETVLYILITGVQVYTVHKWLLGNSLLGT